MQSATTTIKNVAIGMDALASMVTGDGYNTVVGNAASYSNTTGSYNVSVGASAMYANTTGTQNVAVGYAALDANSTGSSNTAVGYGALGTNTTASGNTAFGDRTLLGISTGANNTGVGMLAGRGITTGANNVCLGLQAGYYSVNIVDGAQNVMVGNYTKPSATDGDYQFVIGYDVAGSGDDTFTFGKQTTDTTCSLGGTTWSAPSDIRLKEDIQDEVVGLDFINELRPVTFLWKKEKDVPKEMVARGEGSEERVMNGKYNHGFVAQEVKEVIDRYDLKEGFDMWTEDDADGRQRVGESALIPMLVKSIQELSAEVEQLKSKAHDKCDNNKEE